MDQLTEETLQDRLEKAMAPPGATALLHEAALTLAQVEDIAVKQLDAGHARDEIIRLVNEGVREQ